MSEIAQVENTMSSLYAASADKTQHADTEKKTSRVTGRTVGQPELTDKAKKYYEKLKQKYSNMDFVLVSSDMKEQAQANASRFANPSRMVVLIDEEKIERMAEDEEYAKVYEGKISQAAASLPQMMKSLGNSENVKGYGMQVNSNGTTSFFAVVDKSLAAQRDRIQKKSEEKAEAKKKDKKAQEEKRAEKKRSQKAEDDRKASMKEDEDTVTVTASSIEELIRKLNDMEFERRSDSILSDQERYVGQHFNAAW